MALTREIWINQIVGNLFASNSFAARSIDDSAFVNYKTVHVPNAGGKPSVTKGRAEFPATVQTRTDNDLTYTIGEFTTDPFRIQNAEKVELSYDKLESIMGASRLALQEAVADDLLKAWVPSTFTSVVTTGSSVAHYLDSQTGNRKKVTLADILSVKKEFDKADIPAEGRCALLDYEMYNELLDALTANEYHAFLASADAQKGTVGSLFGFDFYQRSKALRVVADGSALASSAAATDSAAGLFWQKDCVSRAIGSTDMFEQASDPTYYSDIVSFAVRAGGSYRRYDKKGVVVLYQGTAV